MKNKKTKIIATIGPATSSFSVMSQLAKNGLNFCRLNMSHGDHNTHKNTLQIKDEVTKKTGILLGSIVDLCGPKIRIGDFKDGEISLSVGSKFILSTVPCEGTKDKVFINYKGLEKEVGVHSIILINDGKIKLKVIEIQQTDIITKILVGGKIKSRRGVNIPGANLKISALTAKDKKDVLFACENNADYIALSFVRRPGDIKDLKSLIKKYKGNQSIIAKIETPEAIECIDEIIDLSDAIMVARGDLAVEIGPENVPHAQKMIIAKCNAVGKPVITATQMLESMIHNPVPTRAEVSDVANAIIDGTDAVMLSEETALGEYPIETVSLMSQIATQTEESFITHRRLKVRSGDVVDSVSSSVVHNAEDISAKAIVVLTESGFTARMISRWRPTQPVIALSTKEHILTKSLLYSGVIPRVMKPVQFVGQATDVIKKLVIKEKIAKKGDKVVISAGVPIGTVGGTNMMMILEI